MRKRKSRYTIKTISVSICMTDSDRFRLHFGPYKTPRFKYGHIVMDEARDCEVVIVDISNARIPWPMGRRRDSTARALVVYGHLVDALESESNIAICHWWGVTPQTVSKWRKALGVGPATDGTSKLLSANALEEAVVEGLKKAQSKARDPARRAKIAAARRGKPRPKHVIRAMRNGRTGKPQSAEARKKMSEAHKRRGTRPPKAGVPWTAEEDQLVRELSAAEAAKHTGRTLRAVYTRRSELRLPDGRQRFLGSPTSG
jgi:hypothetical protein